MSTKDRPGFATRALHAGYDPARHNQSRTVPLYQTTAYRFEDTDAAARLFRLEADGYIYARLNNPTVDAFERRMADLENGCMGLAFASGMAAIHAAVLNVAHAGDEIVATESLYGGSFHLFADTLPRLGVTTRFVSAVDPAAADAAVTDKTRLVYCETIGNPSIDVPDLRALAEVAHAHGLPLVVDNTVATPALCRPLEHGADVVLHSASKYIGGHGGSLGGVVVAGSDFDWIAHSPHLKPYETFPSPYIVGLRAEILRDFGAALSPFNAYMFLQGLETLPLRMERHCRNAETVAARLREHPAVRSVNYPDRDDHRTFENARAYLPQGCSGLMSFRLNGGFEAGKRLVDRVEIIHHLANLGDTKTLILHPASTSHEPLSPEERLAAGAPEDLIRLSIGLEDPEDIVRDLERGL